MILSLLEKKYNMHINSFVMIRILILFLAPVVVNAGDDISGKYKSVSETEWELSLELIKDGTALIEVSTWLAGKYSDRTIEKYNGIWRRENRDVYVTYNGITELLKYSEAVPIKYSGTSDKIPGLKGQAKPWDKGVIGSISLWQSKALKSKFK